MLSEEEKKATEELKLYCNLTQYWKNVEYAKCEFDDYISKDKIREKIEEYNKMINATYEDLTHYADYRRDVCFEIKNVLNKLLEEKI